VRPVLVLTGPPAVGKSSTAESLASARERCAVIEVDDVRQLVRTGAAAPWAGAEGARQRLLAVRNACAVATNLISDGFDVVITDVLTPDTAETYRDLLPGCLIIRLSAPLDETWRRAAGRQVWLTPDEFESLHQQDASDPPRADVTIEVTGLDMADQTEVTERTWANLAKS
jgi:predicted kinase